MVGGYLPLLIGYRREKWGGMSKRREKGREKKTRPATAVCTAVWFWFSPEKTCC